MIHFLSFIYLRFEFKSDETKVNLQWYKVGTIIVEGLDMLFTLKGCLMHCPLEFLDYCIVGWRLDGGKEC